MDKTAKNMKIPIWFRECAIYTLTTIIRYNFSDICNLRLSLLLLQLLLLLLILLMCVCVCSCACHFIFTKALNIPNFIFTSPFLPFDLSACIFPFGLRWIEEFTTIKWEVMMIMFFFSCCCCFFSCSFFSLFAGAWKCVV